MPTEQKEPVRIKVTPRIVIRAIVYLLIVPVTLMLPAGKLNWWAAWAYTAVSIGLSVVSRVLIARAHPDLIAERVTAEDQANVKRWDRVLVPLIAVLFPVVTYIVAGLDERFNWSPDLPLWLQIAALAAVAVGTGWGIWAMVVNRFFSAHVRIQEDRGHTAVSSGPYRVMRHPAYAAAVKVWLATPLALDSLWALIPVGVIIVLLIVRTALEDRTLRAELPGYTEYAQKTRYRILPGVW